jgi:sorting nexin-9/18/33
LFEFVASSADELTIKVGETVTIDTEASGWYSGTNSRGESGLFPANYVELV